MALKAYFSSSIINGGSLLGSGTGFVVFYLGGRALPGTEDYDGVNDDSLPESCYREEEIRLFKVRGLS